ncbi:capsular exopolysaccharide family [Lutimaribacter pacificus]|uniref:Capsular exopolysaccharide family n=1 Tax=Lutimaribacter pacificus TaxID=391948 RepID=A0A1H0CMS3_9RHOB|nr:CpsD/CapB family tyrosine-protein kinase [Lutimaribacter pacificus]SDN59180.1 capsular exopolysaccharide family [Lutimaribacter pacificus]SHJ42837.1 capsular exopolysaccharide family [Lutimaribacter pacificus]
MERIQAALKKAREERDQTTPAAPAPTGQPPAETHERKPDPLVLQQSQWVGDCEALWKSVKGFNPSDRWLKRNRIFAFQSCEEAVPYDVMRTKVLHNMRKNKWSRLAITSPSLGAGKTMTSLNLAFSLARQSDLRIMLIELDMRRPSIFRTLGIKEPCQFSKALAGEAEPQDHMLRYGRNLIIAANQAPARNPAELLQSNRAAHAIDQIQAAFQPSIMIFDTAPLFAGDDTMAFLDQVDCALLMAEAEKSTTEEIDKSEQDLAARTNVLGVVLNKCRYLNRHEEYGKTYGY